MKALYLLMSNQIENFASEAEVIEFNDMLGWVYLYKFEDISTLQVDLTEILQNAKEDMGHMFIEEETYNFLKSIK